MVGFLGFLGYKGNDLGMRRKLPIALREGYEGNGAPKVYLNDKPSMHGDVVIFVSTEEDVGKPKQGWNAVYSLNFKTSVTKRLTPPGVTDYSPAVSPSGKAQFIWFFLHFGVEGPGGGGLWGLRVKFCAMLLILADRNWLCR